MLETTAKSPAVKSPAANAPASAAPAVPFALPAIGEEEIAAAVECMRSGWLTSGPRCRTFEREFAAFLGGGVEAISLASGTAALEIALAALGVGPGDEVITTDYTFSATAMCVVHVGAKPVLVDIDPDTFNIDCGRIEAAITRRTKALIPVHYGGLACDMAAITDIARRHGLRVIEDAAHAFPATAAGVMIGKATSDATAFSFYATKTITTGEGGMLTFADPAAAKRARTLRLHGIDRDVFSRYQGSKALWRYEIVAPGLKANLTDLAAAIGIVQLRRAWELQKRRSELWRRYDTAFARLPLRLPPRAPAGETHACHLYAIRLLPNAPLARDDFIDRMAAAGINCSVHFIPLHLHAYWRESLGVAEDRFPQAQRAFESVVSLPLFPSMTQAMQDHVVAVTTKLLS
ncbi:MAG: DegT/DnrJ/EryC1/StrS family aminotransferase [Xanthobacteraceae bacterium]